MNTNKDPREKNELERKIMSAIIETYREANSGTPDMILAEFLMSCLAAFEVGVNRREAWYGRPRDCPEAALAGGEDPDAEA